MGNPGFGPRFQAPRARVMPGYTNSPNAFNGYRPHAHWLEASYSAIKL